MKTLLRRVVVCTAVLTLSACEGSAIHTSATMLESTPEPTAGQPVPEGFPAADTYASEVFDATNAARVDEGLPALPWSACAADNAAKRAAEVLASGVLEHAPLRAQCGDNNLAGENLVHSILLPADAVDAWMGSSGHRANIVNDAFTELGVSCIASAVTNTALRAGSAAQVGGMLCSEIFEGRLADSK